MSKQTSKESGRSARERAAARREAQRRKERRRRGLIILAAVLAVLAGATGVGIAVSASSSKAQAYTVPGNGSVVVDALADPSHKPTALSYGSPTAPHTLSIYEDFRCPFCKALETDSASVYKSSVADGTLRVLFHPVDLIDSGHPGTSGSLRAGAASVCAAAAGKFDEYHDALFAAQPDESTDGYSDPATLIAVAKKVPGLDTPTFEACVKAETYKGLVQQNMADDNAMRLPGTPTLILDGRQLSLPASLYKASPDGKTLAGSDPAVLKAALQAAGLR